MTNAKQIYLAVDIGASSGRVLASTWDGQQLELSEVHRFENGPVYVQGRMYWDLLALWQQVQAGMRGASERFGTGIRSVGVDTWGVDYGLLGPGDELLGNPRHYRDQRTDGMMASVFNTVSRAEIFAATGLQFMQLNTLYQLAAMVRENRPLLDMAQDFLMIPDLFHWLMTGEKINEFTNATTTQMFSPQTGKWATELLQSCEIPTRLFRDPSQPGTDLGTLRRDVAEFTNLPGAHVIVPGTHDTASAVMAVPTPNAPSSQPDWCYISSGTWSLMGVELPHPIINTRCAELNFTNEGGVANTVRLLKNIGGLWLIQECRRAWALEGKNYTWDQLTQLASEATPFVSLINPDHASFVAPKSMPAAIAQYCGQTNQTSPQSDGAVIRCALESLALRYRQVLGWLESLTGGTIRTIHVVGGGTQNQQLCQMTADACERHVVAGPVEATAIGNAMMQALALGDVQSISAAREIVGRSFSVRHHEPQQTGRWDDAFARFEQLA